MLSITGAVRFAAGNKRGHPGPGPSCKKGDAGVLTHITAEV